MLPVFGQLAGRRYLSSQPDKLVRQSPDAETAFERNCELSQKRNAGFPILEHPQPTRLHLNNLHFFGIQGLTTDISFVALRMRHLSA
jgi:hypothetical protein